jgi:hypothetical protein
MSDRRLHDERRRIEHALDELLGAVLAHRARKNRCLRHPVLRTLRLGDWQRLPPRGSLADFVAAADVVEKSLRWGIRRLGEALAAMGGTALMLEVAEQVSDRDPANAGRRLSLVDHAWDGIAHGQDVWVA